MDQLDIIDPEDEEKLATEEDLKGYCGQDDEGVTVRMQIKKNEERHCWPNQECLAEEIIKRIEFSLLEHQGIDLKSYYETFDVQFYTANKKVLEGQTKSRMLDFDGVLPFEIVKKLGTPKENEALRFANVRVQRYVKTVRDKIQDERIEEIKENAKNPKCLQLLIFDEAHHGATKQSNEDKSETPYSKLTQHYNSQDYPNIIILLVTATPWNLLTVSSKLPKTEVMFNPRNGRLEKGQGTLSALDNDRKVPLHEIQYHHCIDRSFQDGKDLKLMALQENLKYGMFKADFENHRIQCRPDENNSESFMSKFEEATVFTVEGSLYSFVRISCNSPSGQKLYWTWSQPTLSKPFTRITLKSGDKNSKYQQFKLVSKYGNDLVSLVPFEERVYRVSVINGFLQVKTDFLGEQTIIPGVYHAPLNQTFLMLPKNSSAKFYLSLNFMCNSVRFQDKESQRIRHDERFSGLIFDAKKEASVSDMLTSEYCFILLIRKSLLRIVANLKSAISLTKGSLRSWTAAVSDYIKDIKKCHDNLHVFEEELDPDGKFNAHHKPISKKAFRTYLNYLSKCHVSDEDSPPEDQILSHILKQHGFKKLALDYGSIEPRFSILVANCQDLEKNIWKPFGAGAEIIQKCMEKYEPENPNDNGHMAILRVKEGSKKEKPTLNGNKLKQSLCIAKKVGGIDNLEIVQDYGGTATMTCLGEHVKNAGENAKKFQHPESLRIMKKIQTTDCEALIQVDDGSRKDNRQPCSCSSYEPEEEDSLVCKNCDHIHKEFKSYSDLKGLPCLLILINNGRMGDTFPPSFMAMDDRSSYLTSKDFIRTGNLAAFAQEKGRLCRYTKLSLNLPFIYVGGGLYSHIQKSLEKDCCYHNIVSESKRFAHNVNYNPKTFQLEPEKKHADYKNQNLPRNNHFILCCEPQIGKTNGYLQVAASLRKRIEDSKEDLIEPDNETYDSDPENVEAVPATHLELTRFQATVPNYQDLDKQTMPKVTGPCKYDRVIDKYKYPMTKAPNVPDRARHSSGHRKKNLPGSRDLMAHKFNHTICQSCRYNDDTFTKDISIDDEEWFCGKLKVTCPDLEWYHDFFNGYPNRNVAIFTPSFNGAKSARLNYDHLMKTRSGDKVPYLHFVFVPSNQFEQYKMYWANKVALVEVPNKMNDILEDVNQGGIGFFRRFIMRFATHHKVDWVTMVDDSLVFFKETMIDEKGLIRRDVNFRLEKEDTSLYCLIKDLQKIGSNTEDVPLEHRGYTKHPDCPQDSDKIETFSGPQIQFGAFGARKYRPNQAQRNMFRKTHLTSFIMINNKALNNRALFKAWRAREDLHFCNDVDNAGLHVVKLAFFEFFKTHSRDPLDLYIWDKKEKVLEQSREGHRHKIVLVLKKFVKSLKIAYWYNENHSLFSMIEMVMKIDDKYEDGVDLLLMKNLDSFRKTLMNIDPSKLMYEIIVIFPYDENCRKVACYAYFEKELKDLVPTKELDYLIVGSTHRPWVLNDFVVLRMRFKDKNLTALTNTRIRQRSGSAKDRNEIGMGSSARPINDDEPTQQRMERLSSTSDDQPQKRVTFDDPLLDGFPDVRPPEPSEPLNEEELTSHDQRRNGATSGVEDQQDLGPGPGVPSTSQGVTRTPRTPPKRSKILQRKPQKLKEKSRQNDDSNLPDASENKKARYATMEEMLANSAIINGFADFYTFNNLKNKDKREFSAVMAKVVSKPFKMKKSDKIFVRVEDIGERHNHQSCLMYWYQDSQPMDVDKLKPNGHYRIENIWPKKSEPEEHNRFQLKLTDNSKVIPIVKDCVFDSKPILDVKLRRGHDEFMDFTGKLVKIERNGKNGYLWMHFQCIKSMETVAEPCMFTLKSEPSDELDIAQIMKKYQGKSLMIRAAKILQRPDHKRTEVVIYKNFDAIRYYNSN